MEKMDENDDAIPNNALSAEDLLRNKSIRYFVWDEWEKSVKVLPKIGQKQFDPNGSSLQNMQIEKGIKKRADLIAVERVERSSHLASAEWMPSRKRARVFKKSGQDWNNFGIEIDCSLLLIPEEALLLLEMNCLELMWNGVSMSVQQAYRVLIDGTECTFDEYRVYSQLARYGYRLQRFIYERINEISVPKRKNIVDPENGLRLTDGQTQNCIRKDNELRNNLNNVKENACTSKDSKCKDAVEIETVKHLNKEAMEVTEVTEIMEVTKCITKNNRDENVENGDKKDSSHKNQMKENVQKRLHEDPVIENSNKRTRHSKVEIISNETLIDGINIIKKPLDNSVEKVLSPSKWPGSRIQRNVKLLPKRTDKSSSSSTSNYRATSDISVIDVKDITSKEKQADKREASTSHEDDASTCKKLKKHEVIELSDDEIEEVPRPVSRMPVLNLLPNMASKSVITETISRACIPHNIKPTKSLYRYERKREQERTNRPNSHRTNYEYRPNSSNGFPQRSLVPYHRHNTHATPFTSLYGYCPISMNFSFHLYARLLYNQGCYLHNETLVLQNVFHNRMNLPFSRIFPTQVSRWQSPVEHHHRICAPALQPTRNDDQQTYRSSFTKYPGTNSWAELKKRWQDEKTITLDNEDPVEGNDDKDKSEDDNEIEVLRQRTNPLVGSRNVTSLADVYERLRIIKPAGERTVRRRKCKYKISYNVYPSGQHYKKANPGEPMFRVVVIRKNDNPFIEPIDLVRLRQDAKESQLILAHVGSTISYIKPTFVEIPNMDEQNLRYTSNKSSPIS